MEAADPEKSPAPDQDVDEGTSLPLEDQEQILMGNKTDKDSQTVTFAMAGASQPDDRTSQVHISLELAQGARLQVTIEALPGSEEAANASTRVVIEGKGLVSEPPAMGELPGVATPSTAAVSWAVGTAPAGILGRWRAAVRSWPYSLETTLFGLGLLLYLVTHLIGLTQFPIYFFTDEAIQTLSAADLMHNNFLDEQRVFLPTYFKNGPFYNLSASVYLQVIPYLLFGKSIFVTRATSVMVSLLAAVSIGLMFRDIFKIPYWWCGALLLSITPAWFLHSRTAFETVLFVSFYAGFLYFYLLYRYRSPRYLAWAILLAALAFYSYSAGQLVIGLTGLFLLFSDGRYHWQNRQTVLRGLGLLLLLAIPYLRFRLGHPQVTLDHLRQLGSYWVQPIPLKEKIAHYASEYLYGLSPGYWFIPNERDLTRHLMKGYGNLLRATLPFAAIGLILTIKEIRSSAHRAVLILLMITPAGSALVEIGITRALAFIVPATILTSLGVSKSLTWLEKRKVPRTALSIGLFSLLAVVNMTMLRDALVNGPTWYRDYGLGGMQYGARQLFAEVEDYRVRSPDTKILLSPGWANGSNTLARFFLGDPLPIEMGSVDGHLFQHLPLDENLLFIMIPEEYQRALDSGKFEDIRVEKTVSYPDGRPGFYFVRMHYVENIDTILATERQARRALQSGEVVLDGRLVTVRYPLLDMGEASHMFDGDVDTLARTLEANPAVIELTFPELRQINGLSVIIGSAEAEIKVSLYPTPDSSPLVYAAIRKGTVEQPKVSLDFDKPVSTKILRLEIKDLHQEEPAHIHIWEITLH